MVMYSVLAEDKNDVECLKVLINRLKKSDSEKIKGKGFSSCGNMLNKGKRELKQHEQRGCNKFIICYDRDDSTVDQRRQEVIRKIIEPSGIKKDNICILIPVEEMEAWILADIVSVTKAIPSWKPNKEFSSPERVSSPKEELTRLSRKERSKPLYNYATDNAKIFKHLDLEIIKKKCPSFRTLAKFIEENKSNYLKK